MVELCIFFIKQHLQPLRDACLWPFKQKQRIGSIRVDVALMRLLNAQLYYGLVNVNKDVEDP